MTITDAAADVTRRRSRRRPTRTSPASPAADSRQVNAIVLTVSAKMTFDHVGDVPMSIDAVSASTSTTSAAPTTMIKSWSAMSATASAATRSRRRAPPPARMLRAAT